MPTLAKRPCASPGCRALVASGYCPTHQPKVAALGRLYETQRGGSAARGYDAAWRRLRAWFLGQPDNVICRDCERLPATDVHHLKKVRDFPELRLDPSNLRALCHACHSARTLAGE